MDFSARQVARRRRVVRVFVSSTFRDMKDEREYLANQVFPELLRRCKSRRVDFVEVDLRWGITEEEANKGKVIPICLEEIDHSRPFFVGLLGERYGWVPKSLGPDLLKDYPWLEEQIGTSVTELEMIYGALSNPEIAEAAFFYFRDPAYVEKIPRKERHHYYPEDDGHRKRIQALKDRIRNCGLPVHESYADPQSVGDLIRRDLWEAIDRAFPESEIPDPLDQEAAEHEDFALSRAKVYVPREEYFSDLDAHLNQDGPPLVLVGESGVGKSALLANWFLRHQETDPGRFFILHFIGSSPNSTSYVEIIRRIMGEVKRRYAVADEIPTDPAKLVEALPQWLGYASAGGGLVLILDGLNQLEDRDHALRLRWLPEYFPPGVKLIASTLSGPALETAEHRGWSKLKVTPLTVEERGSLIHRYLDYYRKHLDKALMDRIVAAEQSDNPLFLKTLLEELRAVPSHEELGACVDHCLKAKTLADLFAGVLDRWEKTYNEEGTDLVGNAMCALWTARRGLYESELLQLLVEAESPPPKIAWSRFRLAVQESLVSRSGLLNFAHDYLRQAVEKRYLPTGEAQRLEHIRLADFFEKQETDARQADELPWHLDKAEAWERLRDCLSSIPMFLELYNEAGKYELMGYWLRLGAQHYDMVDCYMGEVAAYEEDNPSQEDLALVLNELAAFFDDNANCAGAELLYRRALEISEEVLGPRHPDTAANLNNLGLLLTSKGDYAGAEPLHRRALEIDEEVLGPKHPGTAASLHSLAGLLYDKGDFDAAEPVYRRALEICEEVLGPRHPKTATSLNNLANVLAVGRGDYDGAEPLYRKALEIREDVFGPKHPDTAQGLSNLAYLLRAKGNYDAAEPLCRRALETIEEALGPKHPDAATVLRHLAILLRAKGNYDEAMLLVRRALDICEEVLGPKHPGTAESLNILASLLSDKGDYDAAEPLLRRVLKIRKEVLGPKHPDTAESLNNLALLILAKGDYSEAERLLRRTLNICEKIYGADHPTSLLVRNNLKAVRSSRRNRW